MALTMLLVILASVCAVAQPVIDPAEAADTARRLIGQGNYQASLPPPPPEPVTDPSSAADDPLVTALGALIARVMGWALLIGLGLLLAWGLYWLIRARLPGQSRPAPREEPHRHPATAAARQRARAVSRHEPSLADADALAAAGKFAEAVHSLLLAALAAISRQTGIALPRAATSRELQDRLRLSDDGLDALSMLIAAAERAIFAGRPVDAGSYRGARAAFLRLAPEG